MPTRPSPEDGYGWEKLFSERMCRHFEEDFGLQCRVARFHNVYGPLGTFHGGREKAPAAICRKVIEAKASGRHEIEIWGDGNQTRSFMYIDDCLKGIRLITESDIHEPLNLGSSELVTINQLVDIVEEIAGIKLHRRYKLDAPKGVNGRNSDNTQILRLLNWEPNIRLKDGMAQNLSLDRQPNANPRLARLRFLICVYLCSCLRSKLQPAARKPCLRSKLQPAARKPCLRSKLQPAARKPCLRSKLQPAARKPCLRSKLQPAARKPCLRSKLQPAARKPSVAILPFTKEAHFLFPFFSSICGHFFKNPDCPILT